jgi:hypothetical protein
MLPTASLIPCRYFRRIFWTPPMTTRFTKTICTNLRLILSTTQRVLSNIFAAIRSVSLCVCLSALAFYAQAANLSQNQRDVILKNSFYMCVETAPRQMTENFGASSVKLFCSCYADEIANNITQEQFDSMVIDPTTGRSQIPPGYQILVANANRACVSELSTK